MNGYLPNGNYTSSGMGGDDGQGDAVMMMGQDGMAGGMMGGQSLDEIVNQNAKAMRRQSMPQQYGSQQNNTDTDVRRVSMMDYAGNSPAGPMGNFQFGPNVAVSQRGMMSGSTTPAQGQRQHNASQHQSNADLSLQTSFADTSQGFNPMMNSASAYQSPAHPQSNFDMPMNSPYVDTSMGMQMDYSVDQGMGNGTPANIQPTNMFNQSQQMSQRMAQQSPMHYSGSQTLSSARAMQQDLAGGNRHNSYPPLGRPANAAQAMSRRQSTQHSTQTSPVHGGMSPPGQPSAGQQNQQTQPAQGFSAPLQHSAPASARDTEVQENPRQNFDGLNGPVPVNPANYNPNNQRFDWDAPEGGWPSTMTGRTHMQTTYKNAYSSTGFDMLGVLVSLYQSR